MNTDINIKEYEEKKEHLEEVLFYAYEKFIKNKYAITLQKANIFTKTLGMKAKQEVKAYVYYTPVVTVSESYTTSNYISAFSRFYDKDDKITFFSASDINDLKTSKVKRNEMSYDEYIQTYGKLFKEKYYVKRNGVSDLLSNEDKYSYSRNEDDILRYGISIYEINDHSYKSANLVKKGKNYHLSFVLDPLVSHRFFGKQIKNTGHMTSDPVFYNSEVTFVLDSSLNLISSHSVDNYKVKFGLINLDISMSTENYYFFSDSEKFKNGKKMIDVKILKPDEINFDGYRLIK